eukprot:SAG11_NODE_29513_length_310_cov_0.710900_2_plen_64_part_01
MKEAIYETGPIEAAQVDGRQTHTHAIGSQNSRITVGNSLGISLNSSMSRSFAAHQSTCDIPLA